ncbi:hypothetical protein Tco_0811228 [Tanacetum coccineum]
MDRSTLKHNHDTLSATLDDSRNPIGQKNTSKDRDKVKKIVGKSKNEFNGDWSISLNGYGMILKIWLSFLSKEHKLSKFVYGSGIYNTITLHKNTANIFAYECDFMILEDTTSIGELAFGRPFIDETGLVYDKEKGTVMFKQDDEKITFKMPYTMEIFKETRLMGLSTDSIPPSAYEENFSHGRTHYYQSLLIRDDYMQDEGDRIGIRHLMRLEREMMRDKGEVT